MVTLTEAFATEPFTVGKAGAKSKDDTGLKALRRSGGSYSIMRGDEKVAEKLSKVDADAFNAMSDADKATYVEASKK